MKLKCLLSFIWCMISIHCLSQTKFQGKVSDDQKTPLIHASVTLAPVGGAAVLAFGITDEQGNFEISCNSQLDSLQLNISYIGFETHQILISNTSQHFDIQMKSSELTLNEVLVKAKTEVSQRNDTLIYNVDRFKNQEDVSIADVLKKLPGIDVDINGRVSYQGEYIQKYYIEGLDLLEGKYNLANNNLPANAVAEVQILENHQPIRLLDSLVYSDRASLNIRLKKNTEVIGIAQLGSGLPVPLWEANISPMLFSKNQQMIVSFQSNNTGNDVSKQLRQLTIEDVLDQFEFNSSSSKEGFLALQPVRPQAFEQRRWLNNSIYLGTINHLIRLNRDYQVKTSLSYFQDKPEQNASTFTQYFTSADTVSIIEEKSNTMVTENLSGMLTVEKNAKSIFFKNQLEVSGAWEEQNGAIQGTVSEIDQKLTDEHFSIENRLRISVLIAKNIFIIQSKTFHTRTPQSLVVTPGPFEELVNNGTPYEKILQAVESKKWFSNNHVSLTKPIGHFSITNKVGYTFQSEGVKSQLYKFQNQSRFTLPEDFFNDLEFIQQTAYASAGIKFNKRTWNVSLDIPIRWRHIEITDPSLAIKKAFVEPMLSIHKQLSPKWELYSYAGINNKFGQIRQIYPSYILLNWRNMVRNQPEPAQAFMQHYSLNLKHKNVLKSFFANVEYYFDHISKNLMQSSFVNESGAIVQHSLLLDNNFKSHYISAKVSRYYFSFKTTFSLKAEANLHQGEQFINDSKREVINQNYNIESGFNTDFSKFINLKYKGEISSFSTSIGGEGISSISTQQHSLAFSLFPSKQHTLSLISEFYVNDYSQQDESNLFFDLKYLYQFNKKGIYLELNWINFLNSDTYTAVRANSFNYSSTTYELRPSQILASVKFTF